MHAIFNTPSIGSWTKPKVRGAPPSATAWFSFTPIDERTALVFGGKDGENQWCDAVHMLNMNTWVSKIVNGKIHFKVAIKKKVSM